MGRAISHSPLPFAPLATLLGAEQKQADDQKSCLWSVLRRNKSFYAIG